MKITKKCPFTQAVNTLDLNITQDQVDAWHAGGYIQEIMPHLSPDEREFLISGAAPGEWEKQFSHDGEEEDQDEDVPNQYQGSSLNREDPSIHMKSKTLPIFKRWVAKATPENIKFVDSVYAVAEQNYKAGGDEIVECLAPKDIIKEFTSLKEIQAYVGLKIEESLNSRWGDDDDKELARSIRFDQAAWNSLEVPV
jgi:hypothetical protein